MREVRCASHLNRSLIGLVASSLAFACFTGRISPASAQNAGPVDPKQSADWAAGAIAHAQQMRRFKDSDQGSQATPNIIPNLEVDCDARGNVATFQPGAATVTAHNAFFKNMGTNGRTCFTCHQPQDGWTISAASARARFDASGGKDPLFRLVDGASCPSADVSTPEAKRQAYSLLIDKGLIRIGITAGAAVLNTL